MQPQGTALVNSDYFTQLTADVNAIDACADLQVLVTNAMATLQAEISGIEGQIAALLPLITPPTSLSGVIGWIGRFTAPMLISYQNYAAQLTQTLAEIATLATAIEHAASRLTNCSITTPAMSLATPPVI